MKRRGALGAVAAWLAAAAGLQGCGGGGGGVSFASIGSGGTGITPGVGSGGTGVQVSSTGPVEGFGSIVVNGTRFEIDNAQLQLADVAGLRLGVTVQVFGTVSADGTTGTATLVTSAADLRGAVAGINAAAGNFDVLGVTVRTQPDTVFGGGLSGIADLRNGDPVQVHGLPGAGGVLLATRVEKLATAGLPILVGVVQDLDTAVQTFLVGTQRVRFAGAAFEGNWPASGLRAGQYVRVRATPAAGGLLQALSVEPWSSATNGLTEGASLVLAGLVSEFSGLSSFLVDGLPIEASAAKVSGGPASDARDGVRVEVTGVVRDGVLVAERVRIRAGATTTAASPAEAAPAEFSARGSVGAYRSPASFKVQGQDIDASGAVFVGGTAADLGPGRKVHVTGPRVADDVLVASRVEFL